MIASCTPPKHFGKNSRVAEFISDDTRALRVANALLDSNSYLVDMKLEKDKYYTWKSGVRAPCYCNCRNALSFPESRKTIIQSLVKCIEENFPQPDIIIGIASAGIPWATSVADVLDISNAYLRSEKKPHGVGELVQGYIPEGAKAIIVDDLVASGGSLAKAIKDLKRETSIDLLGVSSIINWGFEAMHSNLSKVNYQALTSYPQLVTAAMLKGVINGNDLNNLLEFYTNPGKGYKYY